MYAEDELLPLSALQHLVFCPRQCGLIHLEGLWAENRLTAEGRRLHERTHAPDAETRGGVRIVRGLMVHSLRLGLVGKADVVEFRPCPADQPGGCELPGLPGRWRPFPVEHKRGREKPDRCDEVQVCAQAICIEEMLNTEVPEGALFYGEPRRRSEVVFTPDLRRETEALAERLHELFETQQTPPARYERKCRSCSLLDVCLPKTAGQRRSARQYLEASLADPSEGEGE